MLSLSPQRPLDGLPPPVRPISSGQARTGAERFVGRFLRDLTDVPSLAGFAASQRVHQWARLGLLRWIGNANPSVRLLTGVAALLLEVPVFVGINRGINRLARPDTPPSLSLREELVQSYRTLGAFRLFGSGAQVLLRQGAAPRWLASSLPLASMYAGIFTSNVWNSGEDFRKMDFWNLAGDSLATLAQLHITGLALGTLPGSKAPEGQPRPRSTQGLFQPAYAGPSLGSPVLSDLNPGAPYKVYMGKGNASTTVFSRESLKGSLPREVINGPLGHFVIQKVEGVPVYIPLPNTEIPPATKGMTILISGLSSNHTRFGELPMKLAQDGWKVRVLVYEGFEKLDENAFLRSFHPKDLALRWQESLEKAVTRLVKQDRSSSPLYIGGYSMGGAGAAAFAYGSLPEIFKRRVAGLILAAPSFHSTYFETPSRFRNWLARRVVVPGMAYLKRDYRKISQYNSDLAPHMESSTVRPWSVDYAAVLFSENAREVVRRFKADPQLPRTLLIHTGDGDPVVSPKAGTFVRQIFGEKLEREILIPAEDGHYPLVGLHRKTAHDGVLDFVNQGIPIFSERKNSRS